MASLRSLVPLVLTISLVACGARTEQQQDEKGGEPSTAASATTTTEAPAGGPQVAEIGAVSGEGATVGSPAPDFSWKGADGSTHALSDYRGKVVMLNFWGTWCPPCRRELPDIVGLRNDLAAKGFEVVGVALEHAENPVDHVRAFAEQNGLHYPIVVGGEEVVGAYGGIAAVPTTFIIDREGKVRSVMVGMQSRQQFQQAVEAAM